MGGQGLTGKERSKKIYSTERGRTGSALEGELVGSMTCKCPLCFYGEGSNLSRLDRGFAMCKTYEHWIGAKTHVSYREELINQICSYTNGILEQIGDGGTHSSLLVHLLLGQAMERYCPLHGHILL